MAKERFMPSAPNIRVVTLVTALAEIKRILSDTGKHSHPFVAVNRDIHADKVLEVLPAFFERLPDGFTGDLLFALTSPPELENAGLLFGRQREQFVAGEPTLVVVQKIHETSERAQGGQDVVGLERRARDGLYVTVALATEKMRACADRGERMKMDAVARRGEIFERLAPHLPGLSPINLFREGQMLIAAWHPGQTARAVMKSAYKSVAELPIGMANLAAIEGEQVDLVRTAGAVYAKALTLLNAQHDASAMLREMMDSDEFKNATPAEQDDMQAKFLRERAPAHHQELANNMQGGPSLAQLMRAASSMDLNPEWIYTTSSAYKTELDCAMLLGRVERGVGAMLEPTGIARLRAFMVKADAADGRGEAIDSEIEAARCLRDLALRVKPRAGWEEFFTIAEANGGSL
jgi:hypothetical protein